MNIQLKIVTGVLIFLLGLPAAIAAEFEKDLVPDKETAIKIASAVMESYLGVEKFRRNLEIRGLDGMLEGDQWIVCHCAGFDEPPLQVDDTISLPGHVGMTLMIAKSNGEITFLSTEH